MARKVHVVLEDDVDGSEAAETISFALDGRTYEIDLSEANGQKLRADLAPWIAHARQAAAPTRRAVAAKPLARVTQGDARGRRNSAEIRDWARANGIAVSERGRISTELVAQYEAAH